MVKVLDRESINRMTGNRSSGGGGGGGSVDIDLSGYATEMWVEDKYVNKDFFSSLFKAYDANGNEVLPNDTDTQIDNIKAMFGFWTDFYISALGTGGHQSVDLRLAQLADVNVAGVTNGQVLTYDSTTGKWIASTPQSGTDMATVWANLAAADNTKQIDVSHLTTALNGYATQTWVNSQISDMATKTWVGQNYLSKNDAAETYLSKTAAASTYLSIAFFNRLFKAYNGTTQVNPNDTATTIDNIKAMFGFWTDFYISALGTGGHQSVDLRLAQLADVNVAGVTNGQVLTYDSTSGKWIASTPQSGTDMATVWANLAAVDATKQINYSHLSGAISLSQGTITIGSSTITPLTSHQSVADNNPTLAWSTKSKVATIGSTDIHVTMMAKPTYNLDDVNDGSTRKLSNYLPLSGGSMTGPIAMKANQYSPNYGINMNNSDIINVNAIFTSDLSDSWSEGFLFARTNGNWDSFRAADGDFYMNNNSGNDSACLHVSRLVLSSTNDAQGTAWNSPALCVGGTSTSSHIEIDSNEIMAKINASTTTTLYLNAEGGNCVINETAGNCGIGTGSPSHKLHVNGGIYSTSYVTALSDAKHKNVLGDTWLTVKQIAEAPAIRFQWKDRDDKTVFAGSIAQYWQKVLPEVVQSQADDTLSLDYQVAALISSITVARKVVNHESRLQRLEKMFALNENDIED